LPALIVEAALVAPRYSTDGHALIHDGNWCAVLLLPVLNDETVSREIAIHRERASLAIFAGVAQQSREAVLPTVVWLDENLCHQLKYVFLVAFDTGRHGESVS
jgi:hypothetical protein